MSFTFAAPALWNSLPNDLCVVTPLSVFKSKLKTYLFRSAFWCIFNVFLFYFLFINNTHSLTHPHRAHEDSWDRPEDHATHPGLRPMQQQLPMYAIQACFFPSPQFFATSPSVDLASSYLQVPTSMQSSRCCQDFSSIHSLTIATFSLV